MVKARQLSLTVVLAIGFVLLVSLLLSVALRTLIVFAEQWLPDTRLGHGRGRNHGVADGRDAAVRRIEPALSFARSGQPRAA